MNKVKEKLFENYQPLPIKRTPISENKEKEQVFNLLETIRNSKCLNKSFTFIYDVVSESLHIKRYKVTYSLVYAITLLYDKYLDLLSKYQEVEDEQFMYGDYIRTLFSL